MEALRRGKYGYVSWFPWQLLSESRVFVTLHPRRPMVKRVIIHRPSNHSPTVYEEVSISLIFNLQDNQHGLSTFAI